MSSSALARLRRGVCLSDSLACLQPFHLCTFLFCACPLSGVRHPLLLLQGEFLSLFPRCVFDELKFCASKERRSKFLLLLFSCRSTTPARSLGGMSSENSPSLFRSCSSNPYVAHPPSLSTSQQPSDRMMKTKEGGKKKRTTVLKREEEEEKKKMSFPFLLLFLFRRSYSINSAIEVVAVAVADDGRTSSPSPPLTNEVSFFSLYLCN